MRKLAIIPARGGSKRIPHKNIQPFLGKPMIMYVIQTAIDSGLFDEVMVSTDDEKIAEIATQAGAVVPFFRSASNSDDHATTLHVIEEVLERYSQNDRVFDVVCCIYPTAPLMTVAHLTEGLRVLEQQQFDTVFASVAYGHPIWRGFELQDQKASMIWPENKTTRTQDLKPVYHDAGQWYWLRPDKLKDSIFTSNSGMVVLSEMEVQDIDTPTDWKLAELKYKSRLE
ncbi:MAG: pseudaminic acid cytidylyltransferase [Bacteroidota bacterium]